MPKAYQLIRLTAETYHDLQIAKTAFEACNARKMTFDEVVHSLIDGIEHSDSAVYDFYIRIHKNYEKKE